VVAAVAVVVLEIQRQPIVLAVLVVEEVLVVR
jgi:hypothetical protein